MAGKKKHKAARPWWRKPKVLRRIAIAAAAAVVAAGAWLALASGGGDSGPKQYLRQPAPPFTLPTVAGEQFSLADHVGHAVLLYFNEGMG